MSGDDTFEERVRALARRIVWSELEELSDRHREHVGPRLYWSGDVGLGWDWGCVEHSARGAVLRRLYLWWPACMLTRDPSKPLGVWLTAPLRLHMGQRLT